MSNSRERRHPSFVGQGAGALPGDVCMPDVGVLALVPDYWGVTAVQVRHQVLTRLAQYFRVTWVNPAREWRDCWLKKPAASNGDGNGMTYGELHVHQPERWLPRLYRPRALAGWIQRERWRIARRQLIARGCKRIILYVWRPEFAEALDVVPHDVSCYHIDDEYSFSEARAVLSDRERRLTEEANQVIVHSHQLLRARGHLNRQTCLVPNGVDYSAYSEWQEEPLDLRPIPRPRIGYVGVVKKHLNLELLIAVARKEVQYSFVFVGPVGGISGSETLMKELQSLPNVYFLGRKTVGELPGYMQGMDVCTLCYAPSFHNRFIYPMKLHEYLATGRPVVGSPIPALKGFRDVLELAETEEEWSAAIRRCLGQESNSEVTIARRQGVAREHDWNILCQRIATKLCERLGPEYVERLAGCSLTPAGDGSTPELADEMDREVPVENDGYRHSCPN